MPRAMLTLSALMLVAVAAGPGASCSHDWSAADAPRDGGDGETEAAGVAHRPQSEGTQFKKY